ncbi:MAG: sulfite exporter TauE/SafE family protein [Patescibacteria group bacterium]|nr:sulfite exporter TauE/SafE family protein [Patescibacteria group bacterium]
MTELVLFLSGIVVGAMNAIAGGGMLLGFPILLTTGISPLIANATSSVITLPGQLSSAYAYRTYLRKIPKLYLLLIIPCIIGAVIGTYILRNTPAQHFQELVPGLILFAVLLFAYQPFLHRMVHRHMHGLAKFRKSNRPVYILCVAMFPLAIYGGYFGAGMGFIMLAFIGFTKIHEIHQVAVLKNMMAAVIVATSIVCLLGSHLINWKFGLIMGAGNMVGGYAGARGAQRFSSHAIRILIITIGITTAIYLVFKDY